MHENGHIIQKQMHLIVFQWTFTCKNKYPSHGPYLPIITAETSWDTDITHGRKNKGMHLNPCKLQTHYTTGKKGNKVLDENKVANGLLRWHSCKESTCQCRRYKRHVFNPWVGKVPWIGKWRHSLVFLPGKSHGQKSLAGYSRWSHKESDMMEHTHC